MGTSLLGLDYEDFRGRIVAHYRGKYVAWPGEPFTEPTPAASGSPAVDWIVPDLLRSESRPYNVENAQGRDNSFVIWIAFQPSAGGWLGRLDAIVADLADALGMDRNVNSNAMDDRYSWTRAEAPTFFGELSHRWDWAAIRFRGDFYQQVA